ncbi:uncharacterized protein M421DRAFT_422600 [Didymella exigua CBS 183.55]|uniref:Uncharacterized protein n=1 Tax=Didymella exigua CBS 183.55 TaxID=1150837 RepID=A0A6A5RGM3_9PLEO|nr:uncharacterized protein M421DRAFT_422600 [Didymella exigua CBS 183.55]KAF1926633.1 hypothetical protein M421DRAFT_422600 [Didymella exigua CBS 183.55]
MVRYCLPSFPHLPQLSYLFSYTCPAPPLSSPKPQPCNPTAAPYTSWRLPICPQKCDGMGPHLPAGIETRVNGHLVSEPAVKEISSPVAEDVKRNLVDVIDAAKQHGKTAKAGACGSARRFPVVPAQRAVDSVHGERTPNLTSLLSDAGDDADDDYAYEDGHSLQPSAAHTPERKPPHSINAKRLTADWLATLPSLHADADSDDDTMLMALYLVDDDAQREFCAADEPRCDRNVSLVDAPDAGASAVASDEAGYELDTTDAEPVDAGPTPRRAVPARGRVDMQQAMDIWCEIAACASVVVDGAGELGVSGDVDGEGGRSKTERPLSHVFPFST